MNRGMSESLGGKVALTMLEAEGKNSERLGADRNRDFRGRRLLLEGWN